MNKEEEEKNNNERMKKVLKRIAMLFLGVHGLMELSGIFMIFTGASDNTHSPVFYMQWLNQNIAVVSVFGVCAGIIRLTAFIGLWKNRKWAAHMTIYISLVTFATLTFYLPYGAIDAVMATPPFIIMLILLYYKSDLIE
ncbi:MAG: hypothetical protein ABUK01_11700 [Leptospirales bacterium]